MGDAPACIDCPGEHLILEPSNSAPGLNAANISTQTWGRWHADARLARLHDLPVDRLPSYAHSFHGLGVRKRTFTAANCASCHGVHEILRSSEPRSTINAANLSKVRSQCQQGAKNSPSVPFTCAFPRGKRIPSFTGFAGCTS